MTIWILALLLLASLAGMGYRQGAIRVAASFVGILFAALLAAPVSRLIAPLLKLCGLANPILLWALPPFIVFCIVLTVFKIIGYSVHQKVDVHYKYKTGELQQALWERLNARAGLCLGLLNGLAYFVLISFVIYGLSYWTVQISTGEDDPKAVRLINSLGRDLQSTGMTRAAAAVGSLPASFFDAADLAGLLYHNPLLEARLARYPGLLSLGERAELQTIAHDNAFTDLRARQRPCRELLDLPSVQGVTGNPDLLRLVWATVSPNVKDLSDFLASGKSARYDGEEILGRWFFDVNASVLAYRKEKPNLPQIEVQKVRRWIAERYAKATLIATPEETVFVKNLPVAKPGQPASAEVQTLQGNWKKADGNYSLAFPGQEERRARINGSRLSF
ncbi:MAG: CvpA family protein, partial [Verrucomicrobia bacterium]